MRKSHLYIAGGLILTGVSIFAVVQIREKRRRKKAVEFFGKQEAMLDPKKGIKSEEALSADYKDALKKSVKGKICVLSDKKVAEYAKKIYNAWGWIDDDEEQVYSVFDNLNNKVYISQVAKKYYDLYNISLKYDLENRMSESEVREIMTIINKKPAYKICN